MQLFCADASGKILYGCFFDGGWSFGQWNKSFLEWAKPSIKVLELYTLCIGIIAWGNLLQNTRVIIFCDNQVIVEMVNNTTSGCKNCMHLLWLLVLNGLQFNRRVSMKYVKSSKNILADSLPRLKFSAFWGKVPENTELKLYPVPGELWSIEKFWQW